MDRQSIIGFVLIGIILMAWLYLNTPEPEQKKPDPVTVQDSNAVKSPDSLQTVTPKVVESAPGVTAVSESNSFFPQITENEIFTVETDVFIIEFNRKGGSFHRVFLKKFNNWFAAGKDDNLPYYKKFVQLIPQTKAGNFDIQFITRSGLLVNTANVQFTASVNQAKVSISEGDSLLITFTAKNDSLGSEIVKSFLIRGSTYDIGMQLSLNNLGKVIANNRYDIVWQNGIRAVEDNSVDEANYSNASMYYGDEQVIVNNSSINDTEERDVRGLVDWVAVRNKYFSVILSPDNPAKVEGAFIKGRAKALPGAGIEEIYDFGLKMPFNEENKVNESFLVYIGPVDYDNMKHLGRNLTEIVDFGSFFGLKFIVRPIAEYLLMPLFSFLYSIISNYGLVIIIFSLIIKIALNPLTKASYLSMKKIQLLQPKMNEVKEKFKNEPEKQQKEMMALYSTYGVNPASGCLPMLLQMPIFIALWGVFQTSLDLRQQPFIGWITDLSKPDVVVNLPFALPLLGIQSISGLAILMGITTFISQKMTTKDPQQKALVYIMPVFLTLLFMSFPSGLNLYYFCFNLFSIAQQYLIYNKQVVDLQPIPPDKRKKGFMQRMMEKAETTAKSQQQGQKKRK